MIADCKKSIYMD
jgi:hypothetical protein